MLGNNQALVEIQGANGKGIKDVVGKERMSRKVENTGLECKREVFVTSTTWIISTTWSSGWDSLHNEERGRQNMVLEHTAFKEMTENRKGACSGNTAGMIREVTGIWGQWSHGVVGRGEIEEKWPAAYHIKPKFLSSSVRSSKGQCPFKTQRLIKYVVCGGYSEIFSGLKYETRLLPEKELGMPPHQQKRTRQCGKGAPLAGTVPPSSCPERGAAGSWTLIRKLPIGPRGALLSCRFQTKPL